VINYRNLEGLGRLQYYICAVVDQSLSACIACVGMILHFLILMTFCCDQVMLCTMCWNFCAFWPPSFGKTNPNFWLNFI